MICLVAAALLAGLCSTQSCSNDPWPAGCHGVLGDEALHWDALTPKPTTYEVCDADLPDRCAVVPGGSIDLVLPGTSLLDPDSVVVAGTLDNGRPASLPRPFVRLWIRACDQHEATQPAVCSVTWSNVVEVLPFACFKQTGIEEDSRPHCPNCTRAIVCETPCFTGAPYRLATVRRCEAGQGR